MKCPMCGKEMEAGEVANSRGDTMLFWVPKTYMKKHWLNPYNHRRKIIESEGGIMIKVNSRVHTPAPTFACSDCKIVMIDCK